MTKEMTIYDDNMIGIRQLFGDYKNDKFTIRQLQQCLLAPMIDKSDIDNVTNVLAYMAEEIAMFGEINKKDDRFIEVPAKMLMEENTGTIIFLTKYGTEVLLRPMEKNDKGGVLVFNRYTTKKTG